MGSMEHEVFLQRWKTDHAAIRRSVTKTIEAMIELLDLLDGDPDLEDDDPAGGAADDLGEPELSKGLPLPRWGIDQRRGPLNEEEVGQNWYFDETAGRAFAK